MGQCFSTSVVNSDAVATGDRGSGANGENLWRDTVGVNGNGVTFAGTTHVSSTQNTPARSFTASPSPSLYPSGIMPSPSPARKTPRRYWPFPPPSPARPILTMLRKRGKRRQLSQGTIQEEGVEEGVDGGATTLDKTFDYAMNIGAKFELGKEVGRGHFGHTCWAKGKKGELKGQPVAVKIISKDKVCAYQLFVGSDCNASSFSYSARTLFELRVQSV